MNEREHFHAFELIPIGSAISKLGEATYADKDRAICAVSSAVSNLNEFLGNASPAPSLTEDEANWSSSLHTYMRKYMDGPPSSGLYRMVSENRAKRIWYQFVKIVAERTKQEKPKNFTVENVTESVRRSDDAPLTTDDVVFLDLLNLWPDFQNAVATVKEWNEQ